MSKSLLDVESFSAKACLVKMLRASSEQTSTGELFVEASLFAVQTKALSERNRDLTTKLSSEVSTTSAISDLWCQSSFSIKKSS